MQPCFPGRPQEADSKPPRGYRAEDCRASELQAYASGIADGEEKEPGKRAHNHDVLGQTRRKMTDAGDIAR